MSGRRAIIGYEEMTNLARKRNGLATRHQATKTLFTWSGCFPQHESLDANSQQPDQVKGVFFMPFESPRFTQTPNDLFAMLPDMSLAELKVTLAAIRQTFGFHRESFKLSVADMEKLTGLSKQSVLTGAEAAETRGTMRRETSGGVTLWVVQILDPHVVQNLDSLHSIKERKKHGAYAPKKEPLNYLT